MSALEVFGFDGAEVWVVPIEGKPWLVANDVARVLGYVNPVDAISKHAKGVANR